MSDRNGSDADHSEVAEAADWLVTSVGRKDVGGRDQSLDEIDLDTKMLEIQHKRFYLDVKQNNRGRFIKIAELGNIGRKSRLLLTMPTALEFRDHLSSFIKHCAQLSPIDPEQPIEDEKLKSETMTRGNRIYYIDLKENSRGRFLRLSQIHRIARRSRSQIAIPATGLKDFHDALSELLDKYSSSADQEQAGDDPSNDNSTSATKRERSTNAVLKTDNKSYHFDVRQNQMGVYMRISEKRNHYTSTITIPEKSWTQFRDILNELIEKSSEQELDLPATTNPETATEQS